MGGDVDLRSVDEQNRDVAGGGLELGHPFEQEERLDDLQLKPVAELVFGQTDGRLHIAADRGGDAVVHEIERGKAPDVGIADRLGDFLEDRQHGALPHRHVPADEDAVLRELLDAQLEEGELVGVERV